TLTDPPSQNRERAPGHRLARGVLSALGNLGFEALGEFPAPKGRRMDLCAIGPKGEIWCVEVKSSRADFQADGKWPLYLPWCERLFFAVPQSFPASLIPAEQGLIVADDWDAEILRLPAERPMAASRRRSMTLSFARLAAHRLASAGDWRSADVATPFLA
ncbi:MAG: MmcB family DNA repair protein, partial [Pseudomonadota bacterium]